MRTSKVQRLSLVCVPCRDHSLQARSYADNAIGEVFSYPNHLTWEFSAKATRSLFPLWPVYGLPMEILRWLHMGISSDAEVPPRVVYYTLRLIMFMASFILEDWAIYELVPNPRQRRVAVILVASSYVTWTYQTHTFSNSVETIVVLWCLVLIQRIMEKPVYLFCSSFKDKLIRLGTLVHPLCCSPWNTSRLWHIQSHYFSSISCFSSSLLDTPFSAEVCYFLMLYAGC